MEKNEQEAKRKALSQKINDLKDKLNGLSGDASQELQDKIAEVEEIVCAKESSGDLVTLTTRPELTEELAARVEEKLQGIEQEIAQALKDHDQETGSVHVKTEDQDQQDKDEEKEHSVSGMKSGEKIKMKVTVKSGPQSENSEAESEVSEHTGRKKQYALSAVAAISSGVGVWYGAEKLYQVSAVTSVAAASLVGIAVGFAAYKMCSKKDVEKDIGVELQNQKDQSSELRLVD